MLIICLIYFVKKKWGLLKTLLLLNKLLLLKTLLLWPPLWLEPKVALRALKPKSRSSIEDLILFVKHCFVKHPRLVIQLKVFLTFTNKTFVAWLEWLRHFLIVSSFWKWNLWIFVMSPFPIWKNWSTQKKNSNYELMHLQNQDKKQNSQEKSAALKNKL